MGVETACYVFLMTVNLLLHACQAPPYVDHMPHKLCYSVGLTVQSGWPGITQKCMLMSIPYRIILEIEDTLSE